ncbi:hypothetical protein ETB97_011569 [Aspergillus alliaceus]|uniref:Uncharacterized protein n=1 Tax=Petromyces alliaceus TaxID=209559 RepID=A0A8H6E0H0_PETAA|nr:hypothetical protein ETB97_011569 [Aspergillus burnettii]
MAPGIPGLPFALQVQVDAVHLDNQLLSAAQNVDNSGLFGAAGSLQVGLSLIQLQPTITTMLKDIAEMSDAFGDLGVIVLATLFQLKKDTDIFAAAIVHKLDTLEAAIAPAIVKSIDDAFDDAITVYRRHSI